jgi:hypothetical protein
MEDPGVPARCHCCMHQHSPDLLAVPIIERLFEESVLYKASGKWTTALRGLKQVVLFAPAASVIPQHAIILEMVNENFGTKGARGAPLRLLPPTGRVRGAPA